VVSVPLISRTLLCREESFSNQCRLRVLPDQEKPNTEVIEILRGLCVEALRGRRTRRSPFGLRPPGRAVRSVMNLFFAAGEEDGRSQEGRAPQFHQDAQHPCQRVLPAAGADFLTVADIKGNVGATRGNRQIKNQSEIPRCARNDAVGRGRPSIDKLHQFTVIVSDPMGDRGLRRGG
jgi:hypothetical protein